MRWDIACNSRVSATAFSMATFLQLNSDCLLLRFTYVFSYQVPP
jgi:hypothetical protein